MLGTVALVQGRTLPQAEIYLEPTKVSDHPRMVQQYALLTNRSDLELDDLRSDTIIQTDAFNQSIGEPHAACIAKDVYHVLANGITLATESSTSLSARLNPVNEVSDASSVGAALFILGALALVILVTGHQFPRAATFIMTGVMSFLLLLFLSVVIADPNTALDSDRTFSTCVLPFSISIVLSFCVAAAVTCAVKQLMLAPTFIFASMIGLVAMAILRSVIVASYPALADDPKFACTHRRVTLYRACNAKACHCSARVCLNAGCRVAAAPFLANAPGSPTHAMAACQAVLRTCTL